MDYRQGAIDAVKARVSLAKVVGAHTSLRSDGRQLKGRCPFHEEKTPSFLVDEDQGVYYCHGCGVGGDVITFVREVEGLSFREAVEELAAEAGISLGHETSQTGHRTSRQQLQHAAAREQEHYRSQLGPRATSYLSGRGIDLTFARRFGLGWGGMQGWMADRLVFPIQDQRGRVIGFAGRTLSNQPPKYINSAESTLYRKGRTLYALNHALPSIRRERRALVVEGYTDVLACHQRGITETVATCGTALTEHHASRLARLADKVVLLFDADTAGRKAAVRALPLLLRAGVDPWLATLPDGEDPGSRPDLVPGSVEAARPLLTVALSWLREQLQPSPTNDAKAAKVAAGWVRAVRYGREAAARLAADVLGLPVVTMLRLSAGEESTPVVATAPTRGPSVAALLVRFPHLAPRIQAACNPLWLPLSDRELVAALLSGRKLNSMDIEAHRLAALLVPFDGEPEILVDQVLVDLERRYLERKMLSQVNGKRLAAQRTRLLHRERLSFPLQESKPEPEPIWTGPVLPGLKVQVETA